MFVFVRVFVCVHVCVIVSIHVRARARVCVCVCDGAGEEEVWGACVCLCVSLCVSVCVVIGRCLRKAATHCAKGNAFPINRVFFRANFVCMSVNKCFLHKNCV